MLIFLAINKDQIIWLKPCNLLSSNRKRFLHKEVDIINLHDYQE